MLKQVSNVYSANYSNIMNPSAHDTSILNYNGNSIHLERSQNDVMINLTEMAKSFPRKNLAQIISSHEIQDYIKALTEIQNYISTDLLQVRKGGDISKQGTWAHKKVALRVAQKLSPEFAVWVDTKIDELLTSGVATVNNDDETIMQAMSILQLRLEQNRQRLQALEESNNLQQKQISKLEPKARYTDEVLQSASTFTTTQMADDLGMTAATLNAKLKELGIQYKQSGQWHLTSLYKSKGYTDIRVASFKQGDKIGTSQSMVWTESGRLFLANLRKNGQI